MKRCRNQKDLLNNNRPVRGFDPDRLQTQRMELVTRVPLEPEQPGIGYDSKILLLGSCFVEHIGDKLEYFKFHTLQNPFGILFHPAAISGFLEKVRSGYIFSSEDVFQHNERWHSFDAHSDLSHPEKETVLQELNRGLEISRTFLKEATHVVITPGTAWAYSLIETGRTVANCHKVPQKNFQKSLRQVEEDLTSSVEVIRSLNADVEIIFTVSPVRHLRDGFVENQQSKARLISGVHKVISSSEDCHYFPSYEIMMDELRDYRFYAADMVHPNSIAVDYIWEKFSKVWIAPEAERVMNEVERIRKGLAHKPFNETSEAHQKFLKDLHKRINLLQEMFPQISFR